jgi:YidC/Oxa1 family membrane protein insertase
MDKNSIFGIILIAAILIVWGIIQKPNRTQLGIPSAKDTTAIVSQVQTGTDSIAVGVKNDTKNTQTVDSDSVQQQKLSNTFGDYAPMAAGENKFYSIENDLVKIIVSTKGGRPYSVELKQYKTFWGKPVVLFNGDSTLFGINFYNQNRLISTNELYFQPSDTLKHLAGESSDSLIMRMTVSEGRYIEYCYTLEPGSYMVNFTIRLSGMNDISTPNPSLLDMFWEVYVPQHEQLKKNENQYTSVYFRHFKEDVDFFKTRTNKAVQQQNISTQIEWVAFKNQFFSSVLISDEAFSNALLTSSILPDSDKYLKNFRAELGLPFKRLEKESIPLKFYFGPNKFRLLKHYKEYKLENLVSVGKGIIRWINQFVIIPIFDWLNRFIGNYGIIILLLTIIIKIGLLPLTYRSYFSMAKMKVLKPQIDELTNKYPKGKEMERQQATMALYKKAGVSPFGGCLPQLLQFPILFAMFRFFPTSIELRQEAFLWAKDLSTYDAFITWNQAIPLLGNHLSLFTVLMTISTIISMKLSDTTTSSQQMPGMKSMMYIMPVMFLFALNNFSAGLTYYYFLANVITIGQNYLFKQFVDEKEILRKIEEKKAKPVKKSRFQQRLEEMARQQQKKPVKRK